MLADYYEAFVRQMKTSAPDGYGGSVETWTDGDTILAGISMSQGSEALIAYKNGLKTIYTLVHPPDVTLSHGDRLKRVKDGRIYRVTSDSLDMRTPDVACVQYAQVTAEVIKA